MKDQKLYNFCKQYFTLVNATLHHADDFALSVELPKEVDKELTDRPFYWMWVETLGETPPPNFLYLLFDDLTPSPEWTSVLKDTQKPERVLPGSYRMQKIYQSAKLHGMFAVAYERKADLWPHVLINVKVSYISDRQKDELLSYLFSAHHQTIKKIEWNHWEKNLLYDEPQSGSQIVPLPINYDLVFSKLLSEVTHEIEKRDQSWARESSQRLKKELTELDQYYETMENKEALAAEQQLRKAEITWRMSPRVEVNPYQLALLYLSENT